MRLGEFDPHLPNDVAHRHEFRLRTRCVTALYERCFPGLVVDQAWKILVECVDPVKGTDIRDLLGVLVTEAYFSWATWEHAAPLDRKKMALATLQDGVRRVAAEKGWPVSPFEEAFESVVARGYVNEFTWPDKPKTSPDRRHKAWLFNIHDMDVFRSWLVIADKSGREVARELAFEVAPSEFQFAPKMGKLLWTSNDRVSLVGKRDAKEVMAFSLPSKVG
jgi:hypothetical protein